ncbi:hypothetical protein PGH07_01030 [Sulfurovum sp. zt1-1]|uniref:Uncharacterized protein n=1 Tax=Sulfurovum zhangzhouensis TaxID=3019067 RepID=A0ABT7QV87_9BACT|nr:hypothetical protein [Sulfurovum zhangzhouensis]MDM5270755.1 hypothetical protein [Sulfurovum zhangzhouensis]
MSDFVVVFIFVLYPFYIIIISLITKMILPLFSITPPTFFTLLKKYSLIFFIMFLPLPVLSGFIFAFFNDISIPLIVLVTFYIYLQHYLMKTYILTAKRKTLPYKAITTIFVLLILSVSLIFLALDNVPRYMSWYTLDDEKITSSAISYSGNAPVCLYIVECSSGVPKLELISDIDKLNLDEIKELIWKRRIYNFCEGYTENIVLDFPEDTNISSARWSFYNDRFITNNGHWQGSWVSIYDWEKCTVEKATWNKQN